jgi:NAD-dependent DNA ligase
MTSKISSVTRTSKTTSKDARSLKRHGRIRKPKNGAPMKQIFKGKEMSLSGKFMSCSKTATHEQIANWIMSHGGTFVTEVSESTTHLICSIEDFKNRTDQGMIEPHETMAQ